MVRSGVLRPSVASVLVVASGCAPHDAADGTTTMIIDPVGWEIVEGADDPYAAERPADVTCLPVGVTQEDFGGQPGLEVATGLCDWVSVRQPSTARVPAGAEVLLRLWHFELSAAEPGEARLAVWIDGAEVWERRIPIPSDSGLVRASWTMPREAAEGAPIVFHVDNHGANTYTLLEISAVW